MDDKFEELKQLIRESRTQTVEELKTYVNTRLEAHSVRLEGKIQKQGEELKEELREEMQEGYRGIAELIERSHSHSQ